MQVWQSAAVTPTQPPPAMQRKHANRTVSSAQSSVPPPVGQSPGHAAYDCYDAVLSRRDLPYEAKTAYLAARRGRTFGLGAAVAGMLLVPVLNLVALGVGAAGATLAVLDEK